MSSKTLTKTISAPKINLTSTRNCRIDLMAAFAITITIAHNIIAIIERKMKKLWLIDDDDDGETSSLLGFSPTIRPTHKIKWILYEIKFLVVAVGFFLLVLWTLSLSRDQDFPFSVWVCVRCFFFFSVFYFVFSQFCNIAIYCPIDRMITQWRLLHVFQVRRSMLFLCRWHTGSLPCRTHKKHTENLLKMFPAVLLSHSNFYLQRYFAVVANS